MFIKTTVLVRISSTWAARNSFDPLWHNGFICYISFPRFWAHILHNLKRNTFSSGSPTCESNFDNLFELFEVSHLHYIPVPYIYRTVWLFYFSITFTHIGHRNICRFLSRKTQRSLFHMPFMPHTVHIWCYCCRNVEFQSEFYELLFSNQVLYNFATVDRTVKSPDRSGNRNN